MSTPNSASDACRTSRTNTIPSEKSAPRPRDTANAAGMTALTNGIRNASRKRRSAWSASLGEDRRWSQLGEPGDAEERHDEGGGVDEEDQRIRAVVDLHRQRGDRGEQRGAERDAAVRRAEDEAVGQREIVRRRRPDRGSTSRARAGRRCSRPRGGNPRGRSTTAHARTGSANTIAARVRSIESIVRRRSQRPAALAARGPPTAAGSSRRVRIPPTAAGESVSCSTNAINATVPIQSPSDDTPWPMSRSRNPVRRTRVTKLMRVRGYPSRDRGRTRTGAGTRDAGSDPTRPPGARCRAPASRAWAPRWRRPPARRRARR